jgi:hypothetical protein
MATISLSNYTGAEIARLGKRITMATAGYGDGDRKSFSAFSVSDADLSVTFTGPDGTSRTITTSQR